MEQISLECVNENILGLKQMIGEMKDILMEDELELSDEVIQEIEEGRKADESDFISQKDIEAEFLK